MTTTVASSATRPPDILVVEDDWAILALLKVGLQERFRVYRAVDGWQAVETYRPHRDAIDLVLLDLWMPGLDGVMTRKPCRGSTQLWPAAS